MQTVTNAEQIIQNAKFNKFHGVLLAWETLLMMFDGYDLTVYGTVALGSTKYKIYSATLDFLN